MSRKRVFTEGQRRFFNGFGREKVEPSTDKWPRIKILRRWLRHKPFRRNYDSIADAMAAEIRMHLLASALLEARKMSSPPDEAKKTKRENPALAFSKIEKIRLALSIHQSVLNRKSKIKNQESPPPLPTFDQWVAQHPHPEETREKAIASLQDQPLPPSNGN